MAKLGQVKSKHASLAQQNGFGNGTIGKSISSGAQYVILHSKIGSRKVKTCQFGSTKWFWLSIIA
jgi:hypothetical protein